jgi:hypothetical protein
MAHFDYVRHLNNTMLSWNPFFGKEIARGQRIVHSYLLGVLQGLNIPIRACGVSELLLVGFDAFMQASVN